MNNKKIQALLFSVFFIILSTVIFSTSFADSGMIELTLFIQPDAPEIISFTPSCS